MATLVVACLAVTGCSLVNPGPKPPPSDGLYAPDPWRTRQADYLRHATGHPDPTSLDSAYATAARARTNSAYRFDAAGITPATLAPVLQKVDEHRDTSDFDQMRLLSLWRTSRDQLAPATRDAVRQRLLAYRYWYTDPLPAGVVDHKWFWSENHRIIAHTLEYLAGRELPDDRFAITGEPGRVHADRGRVRLLAWLDEKARWGMSEWHSDVYYAEDIQPLLLLAEHGDDEVSARASALLDVLFLDIALHSHAGTMGSTHGRSYMKDKATGSTQGVHDVAQLLFDQDPGGYRATPDFAALLLATATRYRPPEAVRRVATDTATVTDRETMGVAIDPAEPYAPNPTPPPGTSYTDPASLPFWWDRGAMTAWQVIPISLQGIRDHRLDTTDLFSPLRPVLKRGNIADPSVAQFAAYALGCQINEGLLTRATTLTHRTAAGMLSSVQDYRAGCFGRQYHAWQATLDDDAVVFTTHPGNTDQAAEHGGRWDDHDLYWNGGVTMPRVAQSGGALIAIYAPSYVTGEGEDANFLKQTHAYLPTEKFDEVRQVGSWVFGRKGDGYVALFSHRPAQFRDPGPNPLGLTKRYDLVADGGPDNVWISEIGDRQRWGSFDAFTRAYAASRPEVTPRPERSPGVAGGYDVRYVSPAEGELRFGTEGAFTVGGAPVDLHPQARMDNPYARVAEGQTAWTITAQGARWTMDLATGRRGS